MFPLDFRSVYTNRGIGRGQLKLRDLTRELVEQAVSSIAIKGVDYYRITVDSCNAKHILYSKYCEGGAYTSVCRWISRHNAIILTEVITEKHRTCRGWEWGPEAKFPVADPELVQNMGKHIRSIFDQNQQNRRP